MGVVMSRSEPVEFTFENVAAATETATDWNTVANRLGCHAALAKRVGEHYGYGLKQDVEAILTAAEWARSAAEIASATSRPRKLVDNVLRRYNIKPKGVRPPGRPSNYCEERVRRIVPQCVDHNQAAAALGVSRNTAMKWAKRAGVKPSRAGGAK